MKRKVIVLVGVAVMLALITWPAAAINPHFVTQPVCTVIQTADGPAIRCTGGKVAGLGNAPVDVFIQAPLACETKSGANQPGGHLQSDTVTITPRGGRINLPTLTTDAADCPPGLVEVVGPTVKLVIKNAAGQTIFSATIPVQGA